MLNENPWERRLLALVPLLMFGLFATLFVFVAIRVFLPDIRAIP